MLDSLKLKLQTIIETLYMAARHYIWVLAAEKHLQPVCTTTLPTYS